MKNGSKITIEIHNNSTNPFSGVLQCYEKNNNNPICSIWEDDFAEILTERQFKLFEKGAYTFRVGVNELMDNSKKWF